MEVTLENAAKNDISGFRKAILGYFAFVTFALFPGNLLKSPCFAEGF
jgi:hypothetical protein